jgi:integrase
MSSGTLRPRWPSHLKVIQLMLGHASAAMTLDQYGHLFGDRLEEVADAIDVARLSPSG